MSEPIEVRGGLGEVQRREQFWFTTEWRAREAEIALTELCDCQRARPEYLLSDRARDKLKSTKRAIDRVLKEDKQRG